MSDWVFDQDGFRPVEPGDIAANDRGFLLGDGVFETFRVEAGAVVHSTGHADRLRQACSELDLPMPDWTLLERAAVKAASGASAVLRLTITRGPGPRGLGVIEAPFPRTYLAIAKPPARPTSLALKTVTIRRSATSPAARHKTLSYGDNAAARREAVKASADMALLLTVDGHVSGADCANVFAIHGNSLLTPSSDCAIRSGVTRKLIMALASEMTLTVEAGRFDLAQLMNAEAVFVTNTVLGVMPVSKLDDHRYGSDHATLDRLAKAEARASIRG